MKKISKQTIYCKSGDIAADDIFNSQGIILVVKNTVINEFIKEKLYHFGIKKIPVYDQQENTVSNELDSNSYFMKQDYTSIIKAVKYILQKLTNSTLEYYEIDLITDNMLQYINDASSIMECLSNVKNKDEYTYQHSVNVAFYSMLTARWLQLPEYMIRDIIQAALLHDLGKIKIPLEILNKPGKLTEEEFAIIKKHPQMGYDLVKNRPEVHQNIVDAILQHHERIDGSGYPNGLKDRQIGLYGKIIAVCDVFDAMTQNRVYKNRVTPFDSFQMFLTIGLSSFDTHILTVFLKHISPYYIGIQIVLNNGKKGRIVYIPPQNILYPVIKVESEYIDLSKKTELKILDLIWG